MDLSQRFGRLAHPLILSLLFTAPALHAQNSTSVPPAAQPGSAQPENPEQDQIRLAREARARIRARREQRTRQVVEDTYSHKYEVYGGGGYIRFRPGPDLQHINEAAWIGGFTDYLWPRWGLTGELRGYYGTAFTPGQGAEYFIFKPSIAQYTFLAGPQYRIVSRIHWAVSGQILAGADKGIFNANSAQFPGTFVGLWPSGVTFALSAAVPIDYNLGPGLAVRISPDYLLTTFGSTTQVKNIGFTAGVVYRFGRR